MSVKYGGIYLTKTNILPLKGTTRLPWVSYIIIINMQRDGIARLSFGETLWMG